MKHFVRVSPEFRFRMDLVGMVPMRLPLGDQSHAVLRQRQMKLFVLSSLLVLTISQHSA
jgi:hypothetical protein